MTTKSPDKPKQRPTTVTMSKDLAAIVRMIVAHYNSNTHDVLDRFAKSALLREYRRIHAIHSTKLQG